ncbi:hypothetical protein LZ31DRAFT_554661 [Colletotrichum somersetense]|nr:hypothetical protein LZ31DRAFT_554661 [Colletotrichum somersetense]
MQNMGATGGERMPDARGFNMRGYRPRNPIPRPTGDPPRQPFSQRQPNYLARE